MDKNIPSLSAGKKKLSALVQAGGDFVRITDVEKTLGLSRSQSAKLLSRWAGQGWLRRIGVGIYFPVPLDLMTSRQVVQDPWILVPALFSPAYIGGRTAAEYWGLTEQIFRDIVVFTERRIKFRNFQKQSVTFTLKVINKNKVFGTKKILRGQTAVNISDVQKTLVDMLDDPSIGGGIQHIAECFNNFMKQKPERKTKTSVPHSDNYLKWKKEAFKKLISYSENMKNGAIFKRLGFLAERHPEGYELALACKARLTQGNTKLDPALKCDKLVTRWRLWIPKSWFGKVI